MPPLTGTGHSIDDLRLPPAQCSRVPSACTRFVSLSLPPCAHAGLLTVFAPPTFHLWISFRLCSTVLDGWNTACVAQQDRVPIQPTAAVVRCSRSTYFPVNRNTVGWVAACSSYAETSQATVAADSTGKCGSPALRRSMLRRQRRQV